MAFRHLAPEELSDLARILEVGITKSSMNIVAQYLAPKGFGWAQAVGEARRIIPEFSGVDFADFWYNPYIKYRKYVAIKKAGFDVVILKENMIESSLKQATRYMYDVEFDIADSAGNILDTQTRSYYGDDLASPEDIEFESEYVFKDVYEKADAQLSNFRFKSLHHNVGWDY